jgi:hypothetical protein
MSNIDLTLSRRFDGTGLAHRKQAANGNNPSVALQLIDEELADPFASMLDG